MPSDDQAVRLCPYCEGTIYRPKGKTCGGTDCKAQHKREAARRAYQRRRAAGGPRRVGPRETRRCAWCNASFEVFVSESQRYCSLGCGNKARFPKAVEVYVLPTPVPTHVMGKTRWFSCACRVCGEAFVHTMPGWSCSPECRAVLVKAKASRVRSRRRAALRGATVERFDRRDVFERDSYLCHICGRLTDASKTVPHPLAPTLDHVVPLARGGQHTRANCKAAHFICNSVKGHRVDYTHPDTDDLAVWTDTTPASLAQPPQGVGA